MTLRPASLCGLLLFSLSETGMAFSGAVSWIPPEILSVSADTLTGSTYRTWFHLYGRGFEPGFGLRFSTAEFEVEVHDPARLAFHSTEEVAVHARFGTEAAGWRVQVVNPDGTASLPYSFFVRPPVPSIDFFSPIRETAVGYRIEVLSETVTRHSRIVVGDHPLPTEPLRSSTGAAAYTRGLRANFRRSLHTERFAGQSVVDVAVETPGWGRSTPVRMVMPNRAARDGRGSGNQAFWLITLLSILANVAFGIRLLQGRTRAPVRQEPESNDHITGRAEIVRRFEEIVRPHLADRNLTVDWIADELAMSVSTLKREMAEVGGSPGAHLKAMRMAEAERLLTETDEPVRSVARQVGYGARNFAAVFRKHAGVSPSKYRAQTRNEPNA